MMLPSWLAGLTGADKFGINGQANFGDMLQAAGHSMAQHYRGQGGTFNPNAVNAGPRPAPDFLAGLGPQAPITGGPLAPVAAPPSAAASGAMFNGGAMSNGGATPQPPQPFGPQPGGEQVPAWGLNGSALPLALLLGSGLKGGGVY